jgi:predicted esterase
MTPGKRRVAAQFHCMSLVFGLFAAVVPCLACLPTQRLPDQASVSEREESQTGRDYLLYVPSTYSSDREWPLVVACHGTWPYDTAEFQMQEWAKYSEYQDVIVVAPDLVSAKGDFIPSPDKQLALQREDEKAILAIVNKIKRRYNVADSQVFMTCWSAGAFPLLQTGLNNPDIFRALFIRQGTFDERYLDIPEDRLNPWQMIKIVYGKSDMLRKQSIDCIKWLQARGMYVVREEMPGSHRRIDPKHTWRFFKQVIEERPWVRLTLQPRDLSNPLAIYYLLETVPIAVKQKWFFGDGTESYDVSGVHTYAQPGVYEVTVNVAIKNGKKYARKKTIRVAGVRQQ